MEHSYGVDCDLTFLCREFVFHVNREVIAVASPVLRAMVKGSFAESRMDIIHLEEDDPEAFKLALDIVHTGLLGNAEIATLPVDSQSLVAVIDKYELNGVRVLVHKEKKDRKERSDYQQEIVLLKANHQEALTAFCSRHL